MILACEWVSDGHVTFVLAGAALLACDVRGHCFLELVRERWVVGATVQVKGRGSKDRWNPWVVFRY